ncbi:hypothetical protein [Streptomyces sp. RPA4-5]|uniref:hypothetical protein n=1 Tax=Streptomyces sp. RPA4-5 TaxID=2721245 RepID=UPI0032B50EB6
MTLRFLPPAARAADPGRIAGRAGNTAACSRFGPEVVGDIHWQAKSGKGYLLAAGSPGVGGLDATGGVRATAEENTSPRPPGRTPRRRSPGGCGPAGAYGRRIRNPADGWPGSAR